jgi:signal transduction histidine kinase
MPVELAEIAAGLPVAASFALAGGITTLREGRRRNALNEAMHELRRPMQALSLALPANAGAVGSSLRLATAALERLDREINGETPAAGAMPIPVHRLLEEAVRRWRPQALLSRGSVELRWAGAELSVEGDRFELAQTLDNLISNAIEHGGGEVTVEGRGAGEWVCISVCDSGRRAGLSGPPRRRRRRDGRCRRGHGLRVVSRVAKAHGGGFELRRTEQGTEARLCLPLAWGRGKR